MLIAIPRQLYADLLAYCASRKPAEACGFIQGTFDAARQQYAATALVPIPNAAADPRRRFLLDPAAALPYLLDPDRHNVIGLFHSHPDEPAAPSRADGDTLWTSIPTYWIVSLAPNGGPALRTFHIKKTIPATFRKLPFAIASQ
ncbi:M67 family metallopeptidase [Paenibacillus athensensis]|uniref:JAB domain-containing protein n=1 Tax=Paenibacillus athensensis TaxID=1967502 RepID=A0A4Y8Q9U6_9BACL|nr:M67 family metallopeptidase [Paenibacillus athensensis]MCD1259079.1 M67 family metallopeptidase [Paenibacillus athensensis]